MSGATVQAETQTGWRAVCVALVATLGVMLAAFWQTFESFADLWMNSDSYGHGVFVVPICAYAIWLMRARLRAMRPSPWLPAVVGLALASVAWALAALAGINVGEQLSVATMIALVVLAYTGPRVTWLLGFPIAYLMLAVPVWDLLVPPLQHQTAQVSTAVLRAAGVPVYLEDIYMTIPSGQFVIAEVCAGLRYLMAMASIGAFYAFLNGLTVGAGVGFFVLSLGWAILFNWVRVVSIIAVGHVTEMQSSLVHDHYTLGWVLFALALFPLFYAGRWFRLAPETEPSSAVAGPAPGLARLLAVVALVVVALGAGPAARHALEARQFNGPFHIEWPEQAVNGWVRRPVADAQRPWSPTYAGNAWNGTALFSSPSGDSVRAYAAMYGRQTHGGELINVTNRVYDEDHWEVLRGSVWREAPAAIGGAVREQLLRDGTGRSRLVWHVYRVGDRFLTSPVRVKLAQLGQLAAGRPAGAVLALAVEGGLPLPALRQRLAAAAEAIGPAMAEQFDRQRRN